MAGCMKQKSVTFIFPQIAHEMNWDISNCSTTWIYYILNNITEPPLRIDKNSAYSPGLIDSWIVSLDRKQIKLKVSNKYKFHDNTEISPTHVYNRIKKVLLETSGHSDFRESLECNKKNCPGVELRGDIIILNFSKVINGVIFYLSIPEFGIAPESYNYKDMSLSPKEKLSNLSGPYKVKNFTSKKLTLEAFSSHPLISSNSIKNINIIEETNFKKTIEYYKGNENTVIQSGTYNQALELKKMNGHKYFTSFTAIDFFIPNMESKKLRTLSQRKAIFSAMESVKHMIDLDSDIAELTNQFFTSDCFAKLDSSLVQETYKHSGTTPQIKLDVLLVSIYQHNPVTTQLKRLLVPLGIELNLINVDYNEFLAIHKEKDFDLLYMNAGVNSKEPIAELSYNFKNKYSAVGYKNKSGKQLLERALHATTREEHQQLVRKLHLSILNEHRVYSLFQSRNIILASDSLELTEMNSFDGGLRFWNWKWK